jgi:hypothetical protein
MPTYRIGNLLDQNRLEDVLLFSANNVITSNGLIMGAGAARAFREKFPCLPKALAKAVGTNGNDFYIAIVKHPSTGQEMGAFQSKRHWKDSSPLELIKSSAVRLAEIATDGRQYHLNCPGIGLGGLDIVEIKEVLKILPKNVNIWTIS